MVDQRYVFTVLLVENLLSLFRENLGRPGPTRPTYRRTTFIKIVFAIGKTLSVENITRDFEKEFIVEGRFDGCSEQRVVQVRRAECAKEVRYSVCTRLGKKRDLKWDLVSLSRGPCEFDRNVMILCCCCCYTARRRVYTSKSEISIFADVWRYDTFSFWNNNSSEIKSFLSLRTFAPYTYTDSVR